MPQERPANFIGLSSATVAQRWVLALASVASFLVILDTMAVATALTAIQRDLGSSLADLEWTVNAYTLSFAVLLMTAAAIGDRLGRRRVFAAGLALFALSSVACALAPSTAALIASRAAQGAGAATIMPMALALLNGAFQPENRGWAIGVYGSVTGVAAVLGPVLGGAMTQGLGWQWIFWINVPVASAAVLAAFRRLRKTSGQGGSLDPVGLVLAAVAALGFVWGLVRGNTAGWASAEIVGALAVGSAAALAFVAWQRHAAAPMVPPRLFRSRAFSAGSAGIFFLNASLSAAVFLMPQFQQVVLGQPPLVAGLRLLPWGIAPFLLASRAGALADRVGDRPLAVVGLVLQTIGAVWIAVVAGPQVTYLAFVVPMCILGVGFAIAIPALTRSVTSTTPLADMGKASGAYSTMRQLGGAFGIAIAGVAFSTSGSYASGEAFRHGFIAAYAAAAAMALAGVVAATALAGQDTRASHKPVTNHAPTSASPPASTSPTPEPST